MLKRLNLTQKLIQQTRLYSKKIEKRNPKYSILNEKDLNFFEKSLTKSRCITDSQLLDAYNTDWLRIVQGNSKLVLLPKSAEELSAILKYCNENSLAVTPQGGNTGLVGGSVPVYDEIVISTKLMNRIYSLDTDSNILKSQSGCILQNLDEYLSQHNLMVPLDLGAKGSCQIGGNVSTNAGGLRLLRYGSLKNSVLGLEVVLADGTILNTMKTSLRKNNTGFDLNQYFIGAEGTLGIITGVSLLCPVKPKACNLILIACKHKTFQNVIDIFKLAKKDLNEILSAFEFMDAESMKAVKENLKLENPFKKNDECSFYCLAETHGSCDEHDKAKIENFYESLNKANLCSDAIISETDTQFKYLWGLRERLAEALKHDGYNYKYDLSLPIKCLYDLVVDLRKRIESNRTDYFRRCIGYGHMGDGNLHLNVTSTKYDAKLFEILEPFVFDWTRKNNGSVSAEHGLGLLKRNYIYHSKSKELVNVMKNVKSMLDPKAILNPYKTLPEF